MACNISDPDFNSRWLGGYNLGHYTAEHAAKSHWRVTYLLPESTLVNLRAGPLGAYLTADDNGEMKLDSLPTQFSLEGSTLGFRVKSYTSHTYILGATIDADDNQADVRADGSSSMDRTIFRDKKTPETYVHMRIPDQHRAKRPRDLICFVATD